MERLPGGGPILVGGGSISPLDRPALGRSGSIPAMGGRPLGSGASHSTPTSPPAGGALDGSGSGSGPLLARPARLSALVPVHLDQTRSTMARFEHPPPSADGAGFASSGPPKPRVLDKELQAYTRRKMCAVNKQSL